jgi:GNAT superfamily N-acetyltransferase
MTSEIIQVGPEALMQYAAVPISFQVRSMLRVTPLEGGLGGLVLVEEPVVPSYMKDYDANEPPITWASQFDVRNWAFFLATAGSRPVGAAAVAFDTPGVNMLEGRQDLAVLWDIRVHPEFRGQGTGTLLFRTAEKWARAHGCRQLKVETQNINVPACRFYARQGCMLGAINCYGYSNTPFRNETMLLWYKDIK